MMLKLLLWILCAQLGKAIMNFRLPDGKFTVDDWESAWCAVKGCHMETLFVEEPGHFQSRSAMHKQRFFAHQIQNHEFVVEINAAEFLGRSSRGRNGAISICTGLNSSYAYVLFADSEEINLKTTRLESLPDTDRARHLLARELQDARVKRRLVEICFRKAFMNLITYARLFDTTEIGCPSNIPVEPVKTPVEPVHVSVDMEDVVTSSFPPLPRPPEDEKVLVAKAGYTAPYDNRGEFLSFSVGTQIVPKPPPSRPAAGWGYGMMKTGRPGRQGWYPLSYVEEENIVGK